MAIRFYLKADDYGDFSNFSNHGIEIEGKWYSTVEHYFQAMKFRNSEYAERIRLASDPMKAKRLGRTRKVPIREDWDRIKLDVMRTAIRRKFASYPHLSQLLLATRDEEIIEASPTDDYWGCGRSGTGENWLGRILMEVRDERKIESSMPFG